MNFRSNKDLYSKQSLSQKEKSLVLFMESGPISEDISNMSARRGSSEGVEEWCWIHGLDQASQVDDVDGDLNTKAQSTCDIWKSLGIDVRLCDNVKASWISWRGAVEASACPIHPTVRAHSDSLESLKNSGTSWEKFIHTYSQAGTRKCWGGVGRQQARLGASFWVHGWLHSYLYPVSNMCPRFYPTTLFYLYVNARAWSIWSQTHRVTTDWGGKQQRNILTHIKMIREISFWITAEWARTTWNGRRVRAQFWILKRHWDTHT